MAFPTIITGVASFASGIFSSYDPAKHQARLDAINAAFAAALNGDFRSEIQLRCMAGEKTAEAVSFGFVSSDGVCRIGDDSALSYARAKVAELKLRKAVAPALAMVGVGATGAANAVQPGTGTVALVGAAAANFFQRKTWGLPTWAVAGAGGLGLWLLLKRGRR